MLLLYEYAYINSVADLDRWSWGKRRHFTLVSSPFFPVLLAFSSYVIFSVPFTILDVLGEISPLFKYKIQKERLLPTPPLPAFAPTVWELIAGGLGVVLIFDAQYFFWHLVHHKNPHLYRWVYAIHHDYISPFSWSTQHLSVVELMTVGFWSNIDPILLKCHPLTIWTLTVLWKTSHLVVPFGLLGGAMAHDIHHQKPSSNFAPFFSHWDRFFGTAVTVKWTKKIDKEQ
uniref:Cholesterol 25-hydroxylase like 1, tandem duplicate 1 n=1 Tax=Sinocyclocheilus grahami TaxID=75366 RepID=A0A672QKN7_SINGR